MKRVAPPICMESLLRFLLPLRDRETVSGDLYEEFCERQAPQLGPLRAGLWYLRQVVSFGPRRLRCAFMQPRVLALFCAFTALCGAWLGAMDLRLRHPGYAGQTAIAAVILVQALLTLAALRFCGYALLRHLSKYGCLALFLLAGKALAGMIRGADMEGYVLLIAVALIYQALLTVCTLPRAIDETGGTA